MAENQQGGRSADGDSWIRRHPVTGYFVLTFAVSWLGAFLVAAPDLVRHEALPKIVGILMFPAMLLGPCLVGIVLTRVVDGNAGLRDLFSRMRRARFPAAWYFGLLIPPVLVLTILLAMAAVVSPLYTPNFFVMGILFGVPAGFLEEIGWMGFAFPKMRSKESWLGPGILLGLLWSAWHLPVINFLGTAVPHGRYWLPFFFAFALAMTAIRVLIAWLYMNTKSVLLAQLMHVSSTGSLVIFSASRVTAAQEAIWYAVYGLVLWVVVGVIVRLSSPTDGIARASG